MILKALYKYIIMVKSSKTWNKTKDKEEKNTKHINFICKKTDLVKKWK